MKLNSGVNEASLRAKVIRADGTVKGERLLAYTSRNPLKHYVVNAWLFLRDRLGLRGF